MDATPPDDAAPPDEPQAGRRTHAVKKPMDQFLLEFERRLEERPDQPATSSTAALEGRAGGTWRTPVEGGDRPARRAPRPTFQAAPLEASPLEPPPLAAPPPPAPPAPAEPVAAKAPSTPPAPSRRRHRRHRRQR